MSVSGMSAWDRGQAFGQTGRLSGFEPSFGGQTMRYLGGREPSAGTSFASFAVPVYRGSDAGAFQYERRKLTAFDMILTFSPLVLLHTLFAGTLTQA